MRKASQVQPPSLPSFRRRFLLATSSSKSSKNVSYPPKKKTTRVALLHSSCREGSLVVMAFFPPPFTVLSCVNLPLPSFLPTQDCASRSGCRVHNAQCDPAMQKRNFHPSSSNRGEQQPRHVGAQI